MNGRALRDRNERAGLGARLHAALQAEDAVALANVAIVVTLFAGEQGVAPGCRRRVEYGLRSAAAVFGLCTERDLDVFAVGGTRRRDRGQVCQGNRGLGGGFEKLCDVHVSLCLCLNSRPGSVNHRPV